MITNPSEWIYHPDLEIIFVNKVKLLNESMRKNVEKLIAKVMKENFVYSSHLDPIWIARKKTNKEILGICMIAKQSPYRHFDNEIDENIIPYLYNMVTDTTKVITKTLKVSVSLLMKVKSDLSNNNEIWKWLNPNYIYEPRFLNLDIPLKEIHVLNFYKKNGFIEEEDSYYLYDDNNNKISFKMMTFNF